MTTLAQGEAVRLRILAELRRRELALEPTPTVSEVEAAVGLSENAGFYHIRILRGEGSLTPSGRLHLTAAGRALADQG